MQFLNNTSFEHLSLIELTISCAKEIFQVLKPFSGFELLSFEFYHNFLKYMQMIEIAKVNF